MRLISKLRLTIGAKLVGLIAVLLIASVASLVVLSTRMFTDDNTALIQQMNADKAASLAAQVREQLQSLNEKMSVLGTLLYQNQAQTADAKALDPTKTQIINEFFAQDKDFLALFVHKRTDAGELPTVAHALSPDLITSDIDGAKSIALVMGEPDFKIKLTSLGEVQIANLRLVDGTSGVAVSVPFIKYPSPQSDGAVFSHSLTALFRQSRFVKIFSESDIITTFLVDKKGKLLAHPDNSRVTAGENLSQLEIVKVFLQGKANNEQKRYLDPLTHEAKLGAFRAVGFAGLGVVAEVPEAKAFEAAQRVKYRSILVGIIVLCIAFMTGFLYSGSLTRPIKRLVEAARRISAGDFKIDLKIRGQDEIAHLSRSFNEMAKGLEERDRVKDTFNKFHNKEVAEKLLSGEVKLGGERKEATVFFSDVRGFTALSESMEPEQVVEMLNEYMTRMVSIIRKHGGIVDKYVGDAIMALWGVPLTGTDDAYHAVRACLEMRADLSLLNELRLSRGQPTLKIGMGVNTGPLIAGNIGSNEKMEYTVIGDAVNLASRIESMTKEYGTDLLISSRVFEQVGARFVVDKCKSAKVKGKTHAIEIYRVLGYVDEQGKSVIVETPYSSYSAEKSDKVVHEASVPEKQPENEIAVPAIAKVVAEMPTPIASEPPAFSAESSPPPFADLPSPPEFAELLSPPEFKNSIGSPLPFETDDITPPPFVMPQAISEPFDFPMPPPPPVNEPQVQEALDVIQSVVLDAVPNVVQDNTQAVAVRDSEPAIMLENPPLAQVESTPEAPPQFAAPEFVAMELTPPPFFAPVPELKLDEVNRTEAPPAVLTITPPVLPPNETIVPQPLKTTAFPSAPATTGGLFNRKRYFVKSGSDVLGPFTRDEITRGLRAGEFRTDILLANDPNGTWIRAESHSEFGRIILKLSSRVAA